MRSVVPPWPVKTRELHNHHLDSTAWNQFEFRDDDIVISSYAKSGTRWLQQIVGDLLFDGAEDLPVSRMSPWLDLRIQPAEVKLAVLAGQTHRRFIETHLPVDALVYSPRARYIYVACDGRDVAWSLYDDHAEASSLWYQLLNGTPGRVGPPIGPPDPSIRQYFLDWVEYDGYPFWSFWENVASWWQIRHLPNLLLLHLGDLKRDLPGQIRRIAGFLDIPIDEVRFPLILEHCSLACMKTAGSTVPLGPVIWDGGLRSLINQGGGKGRWRDMLTREDCLWYEALALSHLGTECSTWLAHGAMPSWSARPRGNGQRGHARSGNDNGALARMMC
jgi:aryl sulfotransferase